MAAEARSYDEVQAEIVAEWKAAVAQAVASSNAQQEQARRWVEGGFEAEGDVITPGPADAPSL
jgi:hypothetical protein